MDERTRLKIDPDLKYTWIDADKKYPRLSLSDVEANALRLLKIAVLPRRMERTRHAFDIELYDSNYPEYPKSVKKPPEPHLCGLVVIVTSDAFELRLPCTEWASVHTPVSGSRFWKRVPCKKIKSDDDLKTLLVAGMDARRAEFTVCRFCEGYFPPEHGVEDDVCDGCGEKHLGIIH